MDDDDWIDVAMPGSEPWRVSVLLGAATDGTPLVIGLRIEPDPDRPASEQRIGREQLHKFPIGAVKVAALGERDDAAMREAYAEAGDEFYERVLADLTAIHGAKQARLLMAAQQYRLAVWLGIPPRQHVADRLGVHIQTADRLIREARKQGVLEPYSGGQGRHGKAEQ